MKTNPKPNPRPVSARQPRPSGKVFDVMRPGKAPAAPSSRPVVIGHKPGAQQAQLQVSGIGAPGNLMDSRKKIEVKPSATTVQDTSPQKSIAPAAKPVAAAAVSAPTPATAKNSAEPQAFADADSKIASMPGAFTDSSSWADAISGNAQPAGAGGEPAKNTLPNDTSAPGAGEYDPDPVSMHISENKLDEVAMDPEPKQPEPIPYEGSPIQQPAVQDGIPPLNEMPAPSLDGQIIVSPHTTEPSGAGRIAALILAAILFAILILDILLDAGIINSSAIPHTNFF